ncbi:MAG: ABC transporter ATP-binding protein [Desulfobacteraceae bacterium]|nr:MAG: ABC transporter ATP-binding protein [Desulfobacteraceae bacterium]
MKTKLKLKNRHMVLIGMIKENKMRLFLATICMIVVAATQALAAYLIEPALDDIFVNKDTVMLKWIPLAILIVFFLRGVGMYGQDYFMSYVGEGIIRQLRDMLYNKITDLPLSFFYREKTGVLMSRLTNDVNIIKNMVSNAVTGAMHDFFKILFLSVTIFYLIWKLALIAFFILPIAFYPIVVFGRRVRRVSTGWQEAMAELNSFLHETFAGNKIVKAFGMETYEKERFFDKSRNLFRLEMKSVVAKALSSPVMEIFGGLGIAFVIWFGGTQVIDGNLTVGKFIAFLAAVLMLYEPVKKLSKLNNVLQEGLAATDRVFDIIERESDIREADHPYEMETRPHRVTLKDVYFSYDRQEMVLENISIDVQAGEVLALAGMSGGGKSSLVNLIPRFYDVTRGAILIDGIDIRELSLSSLRKQIAIVTQEPILFNESIRNNIAYGNPDASDEEVIAAARAAYAYDFIMDFPRQFDTNIGELGSRLSGGEKQRICIARALFKNAPILILDEATSSLDAEAESLVQKALENLMKGRTTFVIAHRLSTIGYADRIVVIVNGRIVEQGRLDELLAAKGEYYKLYQMQHKNGR